jgi:hypothetical protein
MSHTQEYEDDQKGIDVEFCVGIVHTNEVEVVQCDFQLEGVVEIMEYETTCNWFQ